MFGFVVYTGMDCKYIMNNYSKKTSLAEKIIQKITMMGIFLCFSLASVKIKDFF